MSLDPESALRAIGQRARLEPTPALNVTDRVMDAIMASCLGRDAARQSAWEPLRPLCWVAGAAAVIAIGAAMAAYPVWQVCGDPWIASLLEWSWTLS